MRRRGGAAAAVGTLAGVAVDALVADPQRWHPVAGFGAAATAVERWTWRPNRTAGAAHVAVLVAPVIAGAAWVHRALTPTPWAQAAYVAALTWTVVGGCGLRRHAVMVEQQVRDGDLLAARSQLRALCGRDTSGLDEAGIRRAVIESVAENTSDAAVAPLVWAALAGPAGLAGYRALNTLDAMIGHRSDRYRSFGYAAARLDDAANLLPSRLTAVLAAALAATVGGSARRTVATWRRDARAHPSPNAGVCESAFAGALGLRLGGPISYPYGRSDRPWLGDGDQPRRLDVERAVALSGRIVTTGAALAAAVIWRRSR